MDKNKVPTFLLVDDDPIFLRFVSSLIKGIYSDAIILSAGENCQALKLATQSHPDLIITDIKHPGADGYQLLEALRSDCRTSRIPVFSLTGTTSVENKRDKKKNAAEQLRQYQAGFDKVIAKPFDTDQLLQEISSHMASLPR